MSDLAVLDFCILSDRSLVQKADNARVYKEEITQFAAKECLIHVSHIFYFI